MPLPPCFNTAGSILSEPKCFFFFQGPDCGFDFRFQYVVLFFIVVFAVDGLKDSWVNLTIHVQ